jgi:hypothetical protein
VQPVRFAAIVVVALAVLAPAASSKSAPRFSVPQKAAQGQLMAVRVVVKTGTRCVLSVRYADRAVASAPPAVAQRGRISWSWRVAPTAALGTAHATVTCGRAGTSTTTFSVVGPDVPAKIVIDKEGFSQRPDDFGPGSSVSYGMLLVNRSPQQDAGDTYVLVNFVDASNNLLGTKSSLIKYIGAGATYAFGESMKLRTQVPVAQLEITIRVHSSKPKGEAPMPDLESVRVIPEQYHPEWIGEVDGEVINDHDRLTLRNATFSAVVFDTSGQVIGGGRGSQVAAAPPGSRSVFLARNGFKAIPTSRAASALVSVTPTYSLG